MPEETILIVSQDINVAGDLRDKLTAMGFNVIDTVDNRQQAIETTSYRRPNLVLMDIQISDALDGIETAEAIWSRFEVPVIFVTDDLDGDQLNRAQQTIPLGYVLKPVRERELQMTVETALTIARINTRRLAAEKELQRREADLRALFDCLEQQYYLVDRDRCLISFNRTAAQVGERIYHRTMHTGDSIFQFTRNPEDLKRNLDRAFEGEIIHLEKAISGDEGESWVEITYLPVYNNGGELFAVSLSGIDITEKKQNEIRLQYQSSLLQKVSDAIIAVDPDFRVRSWNRAAERLYGWSENEILGLNLIETTQLSPIEVTVEEARRRLFETGSWEGLVRQQTRKGEERIVYAAMTGVIDDHQNAGEIVLVNRDITEQQKMRETVRLKDQLYRKLVESCPDGIVLADRNGRIDEVNPAFLRMQGVDSAEELRGKYYTDITPEKWHAPELEELSGNLKTGRPTYFEKEYVRRDGTVYPAGLTGWMIQDETGKPLKFGAFIQDLTEKKKAASQLLASLQEKETLLQEIHHRVKNNIAIVSSLLKLQSQTTNSEEARQVLVESQSRLSSMALVHESLYQSENLAYIDIEDYLTRLSVMIRQFYAVPVEKAKFIYDIEKQFVQPETASPLGMITTELITNALKYAFPGDKKGEIRIHLRGDGEKVLSVGDNGVGFPPGFNWRTTEGLGLNLVKRLAEAQLDGSIELDPGPGVTFVIRFDS